jgi:hypothetical protein
MGGCNKAVLERNIYLSAKVDERGGFLRTVWSGAYHKTGCFILKDLQAYREDESWPTFEFKSRGGDG